MNKIVLFRPIGVARRVLDEIVLKRDVEDVNVIRFLCLKGAVKAA